MKLQPEHDERRLYGFNAYTAAFCEDVLTFLERWNFALSDDLKWNAFSTGDIQRARMSTQARHAQWPLHAPETTLYWSANKNTTLLLCTLATKAARLVGENTCTVSDLSPSFVSEGYAIAAVTYAREIGLLAEVHSERLPRYLATGPLRDDLRRRA